MLLATRQAHARMPPQTGSPRLVPSSKHPSETAAAICRKVLVAVTRVQQLRSRVWGFTLQWPHLQAHRFIS